MNLDLIVHASIRFSSLTNPLFLDWTTNSITSASQSWIEEGFRQGDTVTYTIYDVNGLVYYGAVTATITYVDATICTLSNFTNWYSTTAQQFVVITVVSRTRATLEILLNLSPMKFQITSAMSANFLTVRFALKRIMLENGMTMLAKTLN